jgi:hypothetical protein
MAEVMEGFWAKTVRHWTEPNHIDRSCHLAKDRLSYSDPAFRSI